MVIADTSVWIEFLKQNKEISSNMRALLEKREILGIECIFGELLQGAKDKREREIISAYWDYIPKIVEIGVWIEAGLYSGLNNLPSKGIGLIDAAIITISKRTKSTIWTLDKKLIEVMEQKEIFQS